MDSSKKAKCRKKVVLRCRKISSTSNRSQLSFHHATPAGTYMRRINTLLKNNKNLACALQDARCELSDKQKILEESCQYLNKMMFARLRLIEMSSTLKSFIKDFDEALLLLDVRNSKCLGLGQPSRSCRNQKSKLKKVVESVEEVVAEAQSMPIDGREIDSTNKTDENIQCISNVGYCSKEHVADGVKDNYQNVDMNDAEIRVNSVVVLDNVPEKPNSDENDKNNTVESHNQFLTDCTINSTEALNTNKDVFQFPAVSSHADNEGIMELKASETEMSKNVSHIEKEDSGTPKLNIPVGNASSSRENISEVPTNPSDPLSIQKAQGSKIPRIQCLSKETDSKGILFRKKTKENIPKTVVESNPDLCRRKTFVIKESKNLSHSEPISHLEKNISNLENVLDVDNSKTCAKVCNRKTFIVKPSDIPENILSISENIFCDRRKTFVKKSCDTSEETTSGTNKRNTFTLSQQVSNPSKLNKENIDLDENLKTDEHADIQNDTSSSINNIAAKRKTSNTRMNATMSVKAISVENSKELQYNTNIFNKHTSNKDVRKGIQQNNSITLIATKENLSNPESENLKIGINQNVECAAKEFHNHSEGTEVLDKETYNLSKNIKNNLDVKTELYKTNISDLVTSKCVLSNLLLESSESECESIPDLDVSSVKEILPIKTTPIRRQISKIKAKKTFVFDANKKKSFPNEIYVDYGSKSPSNLSNENAISCSINIDNINKKIENHLDIEKPSSEERKKNITVVGCDQVQTNEMFNSYFGLANNDKELKVKNISAVDGKTKFKTRKKSKLSAAITKESIISAINASKDGTEKMDHANLPLGDKIEIQNEKQSCGSDVNEENLKEKHDILNTKLHTPSQDSCDVKSKQARFCEIKNGKRNLITDAIDDIISMPKKSKRKNSDKRMEQNVCNNVKTKRSVNKAEKRVKKKLPHNKIDKNTHLVTAEIHPIPSSLNNEEINILDNKKDEIKTLQVSVVLNDIFESGSNYILNECGKIKEGTTFPLKTVCTDNSCNNPLSLHCTQNDDKDTVCARSNSEEDESNRRSRRCKVINYREISLRKKLRQ